MSHTLDGEGAQAMVTSVDCSIWKPSASPQVHGELGRLCSEEWSTGQRSGGPRSAHTQELRSKRQAQGRGVHTRVTHSPQHADP